MSKREMYQIELKAVPSDRFQPTGFPDLGAAKFQKPGGDGNEWVDAILVESVQSMANRFESIGWDASRREPVATLAGLPWVRVVTDDDDRYMTSSRTEAHRLASAFIKDSKINGDDSANNSNRGGSVDMISEIAHRLGLADDTPLVPKNIATAVFALDPLCLIHGVFFADKKWPGQPKIARALTGFIEASDVKEVYSGGVKRDDVRHSTANATGGSAEGYGSIPYSRIEYTARSITLYISVDVVQIEAYGLSDPATELLLAIARWEAGSLLDHGLRLRTACEFTPIGGNSISESLDTRKLHDEIRRLIDGGIPELGDDIRSPLVVRWSDGKKRRKK